jgi:hypothetical protein
MSRHYEAAFGFRKLRELLPLTTSAKLLAFMNTKIPMRTRTNPVFLIVVYPSLAWNLASIQLPRVPFRRCMKNNTASTPRNKRATYSRTFTTTFEGSFMY